MIGVGVGYDRGWGREWGGVGLDRVGYSCDCMNRIDICNIKSV